MLSLSTLYFPAGLLIGVAAAAPVGPVNLLVIQRTLCRHAGSALVLGLGAAIGDGLFAIVAAFGLGAITGLLDAHEALIRVIGGGVMLGFAIVIWRSAPHLDSAGPRHSARRLALATFTMTVTNPATLLFFMASFGAAGFVGIGHQTTAQWLNAGALVCGVVAGSMLWWGAVVAMAARLRGRVSDRHLTLLNHVTGAALAVFGLLAILAGVMRW